MHQKRLLALLAAVLCSAAAYAQDAGIYLKGTLGFECRYAQFDIDKAGFLGRWAWDDYAARFALNPTVGIMPAPDSDNFFLKGLGIEVGLGIGCGSLALDADGESLDTMLLAFIPRVSAVWHLFFGDARFGDRTQVLVPHVLLGVELPVQVPLEESLGSLLTFGVDTGIGLTLNVTEQVGMVAEIVWTLPFGSADGFALSAGVTYRLR